MTELPPDEAAILVDLSSTTLERIARLCESSVDDLDPDAVADRSVLRRALLRVRQDGERSSDLFAGFSSHLL